jgi:cysteine desulfurase
LNRIYFDNAATTPLDPEVLEAMMPYMTEKFGNPSAIYSYGRETKLAIETARKTVAKILGANPGEIFFTSGGTESTNTAIHAAIEDLGCKHIITSPIEHHATLHTAEYLAKTGKVKLSFVKLADKGKIDLQHMEELLALAKEKTLVTLMHANNEIGNIMDVKAVGELCDRYQAVFHCDMVQTIAHYPINLKELKVHFASSAGHKFHGPKGVGVLYINEDICIHPFITGGAQERNMRAGTENLYGIIGYAKALELATQRYEQDRVYIQGLKAYMAEQLKANFPQVRFNGDWDGDSLYTVLSVGFPVNPKTEMLLMSLDIAGICTSGGSACSSGANAGSHVINGIYTGEERNIAPVRFSFSRYNTQEEIDTVINKLKELV